MATERSSIRRGGGAALGVIATIVSAAARIAALIIVIGILFVVLGANEDNGIVSVVLDVADFLVGPFDGLFEPKSRKTEIAINYGIAAVVYLVVGGILARILRRPRV